MADLVRPEVHISDGLGKRLGSLTTQSSVNRAWVLLQPAQGGVQLALSDPMFKHLDPALGNAVAIVSPHYPVPWLGAITDRDEDHAGGTARLTLLSLDAVLRDRYLDSPASYSGSAGAIFRSLLSDANGANDSGIAIAKDVAAGIAFETAVAFPDAQVYAALNALARDSGHEWWVEYDVQPSGIRAVAHYQPARGFNRYAAVRLTDGGNCDVMECAKRLGGMPFALRVVAGQTSPTQKYTERSRVTRQFSSKVAPGADVVVGASVIVHGSEVEHSELSGSPLTRRQAVVVAEHLRSKGAIHAASLARLGRPSGAERVLKVRVYPNDDLWAQLDVGSKVHFVSHRAFGGCDVPVRIVAVHPMEELGDCILTLQVLKG